MLAWETDNGEAQNVSHNPVPEKRHRDGVPEVTGVNIRGAKQYADEE